MADARHYPEPLVIMEVEDPEFHYFYRIIQSRDRDYLIMREGYPSGYKRSFDITRQLVDYALRVADHQRLGLLITMFQYARLRQRNKAGMRMPTYQGRDTGRHASLRTTERIGRGSSLWMNV